MKRKELIGPRFVHPDTGKVQWGWKIIEVDETKEKIWFEGQWVTRDERVMKVEDENGVMIKISYREYEKLKSPNNN